MLELGFAHFKSESTVPVTVIFHSCVMTRKKLLEISATEHMEGLDISIVDINNLSVS